MTAISALLDADGASVYSDDDFDAVNALVRERGWGDGLPVVPPSEQRVAAMLEWCDRPWDEPFATMAPRYSGVTPLLLAANAVMAGCRPEYFPLVMLAIEALCEKQFNLYSIQATTHPCAPLLIFNGPVARELHINGGNNAFGQGVQANATIGRAVRLALVNIGGAAPGIADMATHGSPAKYTYCAAENEAASPWEPLHVERGFPSDATTVTVIGAECPHNINDHQSLTAEGVMMTIAGTMATTGANDIYYPAQRPLLVLGPEHAQTIADGGYSKADAKRFLQQHAWLALNRFSPENIGRRFMVTFRDQYANAAPDAPVHAVKNAEDIIIIVAGGVGKHSIYMPTFGGSTTPVTCALKRRDGSYVQTIDECRRA